MRLILALTLSALGSACVTEATWKHTTKTTQQEFLKDKTDCRVKAKQACGIGNLLPCSVDDAFDECMQGEGWHQVMPSR